LRAVTTKTPGLLAIIMSKILYMKNVKIEEIVNMLQICILRKMTQQFCII